MSPNEHLLNYTSFANIWTRVFINSNSFPDRENYNFRRMGVIVMLGLLAQHHTGLQILTS